MRLTRRDTALLRDLALSHVLSRDQILKLGYFGSITRANTRLRELVGTGLVRRLGTPFFSQSLYYAARASSEVVGERVSPLLSGRTSSPRFIQHALTVTDLRIALTGRSGAGWRFEQQLWRRFGPAGGIEVRPDGLLLCPTPLFVEADLGHASLPRLKAKLSGYAAMASSGCAPTLYGFDSFRLLVATTGGRRARQIRRLLGQDSRLDLMVETLEELGVAPTPEWS